MNSEPTQIVLMNELNFEKGENLKLRSEIENLKILISELESTNNHLVAATWRERDLKKRLAETIEELNNTKSIVETQNKRITESINYARKIQLAINSSENDLKNHFSESFILYLPKDVISGDFPWIFSINNHIYMAAVDCTGHGVPGAMMSMIGNLLLNDIANDGHILLPSQILKKLHRSVVQTLKQEVSESNSSDGMDIGLCCIEKNAENIIFSGAHRPLFHLRDGKIEMIRGDKFPIGGMHYKGKNSFTDSKIDLKPGDMIFLFTDGLPDQIGGNGKIKLMTKGVKTFLEENSHLPMAELKEKLFDFHCSWRGENKQIDDILMMAIKF